MRLKPKSCRRFAASSAGCSCTVLCLMSGPSLVLLEIQANQCAVVKRLKIDNILLLRKMNLKRNNPAVPIRLSTHKKENIFQMRFHI